jgi:hypothetical protein
MIFIIIAIPQFIVLGHCNEEQVLSGHPQI